MSRIINILMKRDNLSHSEAVSRIHAYQCVRDEYLACGDIESAMDCIMDELGLEPDYAEDLIF